MGPLTGAYIADTHAPFRYASVFVPIFLLYELTQQRSLDEAMQRLRAHDPELATWRISRLRNAGSSHVPL